VPTYLVDEIVDTLITDYQLNNTGFIRIPMMRLEVEVIKLEN